MEFIVSKGNLMEFIVYQRQPYGVYCLPKETLGSLLFTKGNHIECIVIETT